MHNGKPFVQVSKGYRVFLDVGMLEGGDRFKAIISQGIVGCEVFIALISPSYAHPKMSPWTLKEFSLAEDEGKTIIPIFHSGTYPPTELRLSLAGINYLPKLSGKPLKESNFDSCMDELCAALVKQLRPGQQGAKNQVRIPPFGLVRVLSIVWLGPC